MEKETKKMDAQKQDGFRFAIDRGGTFTDIYAETPKGIRILKLLSVDPKNYPDAPREGIRRVLEEVTGIPHPRDKKVDTSRIKSIRMGTTVATNALLERKGEPVALVVTKGFRDLWRIGNQSRPAIFDLEIRRPEVLYADVIEIEERVTLPASKFASGRDPDVQVELEMPHVLGTTGEPVLVEEAPNPSHVKRKLKKLKESGINSIAIVFIHAAVFPDHELIVGRLAKSMGFKHISLSHEVMQMVRIVPRGFTATADAYLTPHIMRYIATFVAGFDESLLDRADVSFMQSDGGLAPVDRFTGHKAILSGPAGGVVGYAQTCYHAQPVGCRFGVIGFDMGGTSTDVSRYAGTYEHVYETHTAGITLQAPQLDISTVAAGGGSRLWMNSGMFAVGPESVGAHPGPVCYRKGGSLAVTDANLVLGRLLPEFFPKIFGSNEDEALDAAASWKALKELTEKVNNDLPSEQHKSVEEVALGFIQVANEAMCRPIREITQMKGFDISKHVLACFGGAGGQHACAIARVLGIRMIHIHAYSGILSAYGMKLAEIVEERQAPSALTLFDNSQIVTTTLEKVKKELIRLEDDGLLQLVRRVERSNIHSEYFLNLRYQGTDSSFMTPFELNDDGERVTCEFTTRYKREFGFLIPDRSILVDDVRVRMRGQNDFVTSSLSMSLEFDRFRLRSMEADSTLLLSRTRTYFVGGYRDTPAYDLMHVREKVKDGEPLHIDGPAILLDKIATIVVEPLCRAFVLSDGSVVIEVASNSQTEYFKESEETADPIKLSIFSHRFMSIAEQMGRTLQRTSVSVNIKERLDFSCALFGPDGGLVANAPHIPVHLGAMQEAVKYQIKYWTESDEGISPGDVFVSNHPQLAGGSHLPDITVMTPVFESESGGNVVFWVASRGHHADIGGIAPGSMPPLSKKLVEEGAAIVAMKLVEKGVFQEEEITKVLCAAPKGSYGTRALQDNLSDLRAQVAANNKGIYLVRDLIQECGKATVVAYMHHIQKNAEQAVRNMLRAFAEKREKESSETIATGEDFMDDGTRINLKVTISKAEGSATFDFEGTGPEVFGNCNAPPAVTYSAIIYSLRCMIGQDIPLNQGCLAPINVVIPPNTILSPSAGAGVVGGNVLTSQRVVDVILKTFGAAAGSQGCMNNLTFGDKDFGYYETIAGGAGAGPTWDGQSGVHTHMTNTRITDPEIFERRYPVVLRQFRIRENSEGNGMHKGGCGVVREIEFLRPVTVNILSERRVIAPYGLFGGSPGAPGLNLVRRADTGLIQNVGGKNTFDASPGDRIIIYTPGGGGYGSPSNN